MFFNFDVNQTTKSLLVGLLLIELNSIIKFAACLALYRVRISPYIAVVAYRPTISSVS